MLPAGFDVRQEGLDLSLNAIYQKSSCPMYAALKAK